MSKLCGHQESKRERKVATNLNRRGLSVEEGSFLGKICSKGREMASQKKGPQHKEEHMHQNPCYVFLSCVPCCCCFLFRLFLETVRDGVKDWLKCRTVGICMAINRILA